MSGIQLFFAPRGQVEIKLSAPTMRHFRGEQAGSNLVTLLGILAHAYLVDGQLFSDATPQQIAAETGIALADALSSAAFLERSGWIASLAAVEGQPGYQIRLTSSLTLAPPEGEQL